MAIQDKVRDSAGRVNDARQNSRFFGAGVDSFVDAMRSMFGTGSKAGKAGGGAAWRAGSATVKGADRVAGHVAEDTFSFAARHSAIALGVTAVLAWITVPKFLKRMKAKKELKQEQQISQALTIAEMNHAKRAEYASRDNNPGAQAGHASRVSANRGQGIYNAP